jgi:superfamily II DNA or RNA helicase
MNQFVSSSSSRTKTAQTKRKRQATTKKKTAAKVDVFVVLAPEKAMDRVRKLDRTEVVLEQASWAKRASDAMQKPVTKANAEKQKKAPKFMTADWVLNGGDAQDDEEVVGSSTPQLEPQSSTFVTIADELARSDAPKPEFAGYLFTTPRFVHMPPVFSCVKATALVREARCKAERDVQRRLQRAVDTAQQSGVDVAKLVRAANTDRQKGQKKSASALPDVFLSSTFNIDADIADRCTDLRKLLWLQPDDGTNKKTVTRSRFRRKKRKYPIFDEKRFSGTKKRYVRMPRPYGLECFPDVHLGWHTTLMKSVDQNRTRMDTFDGQLLPYQEPAVNHVLSKLKTLRCRSGLLEAACGAGKTIMALYIMSVLKTPAVVVVHTEVLFDQWQDRIKQFLPNAKVGTLRAKKRPDPDCDVCVAMLQTTSQLDESETHALERFGLLVLDECHHICAQMFSQCLRKFMAPYQLGLSATIQRGDGLAHAIEWLIGPRLYSIERVNSEVDVMPVAFKDHDFKHEESRDGDMDYTATMTQMLANPWRTRRIAEVLYDLATREKRQIVAISCRTQLLQDLHALLPGSGLIIGKGKFTKKQLLAMVPPELEEAVSKVKLKRDIEKLLYDYAKTKRIILASQNLLAEGADIPRLDTLVLLTPIKVKENHDEPHMKNTKLLIQAIGRIQRGVSKRRPLVVDFYDSYKMFLGSFRARQKWYADQQFRFRKSRTLCKPFVRPSTELRRALEKPVGSPGMKEKKKEKKQPTLSFALFEEDQHFDVCKSVPNCVDSNAVLARLTHEVLDVVFPRTDDIQTSGQATWEKSSQSTQTGTVHEEQDDLASFGAVVVDT